ncbi:hypothetical protein CYLTODRAFT_417144, partial [Cylindrobasidium torrendii FP15055 ss-10]
MSRPRVRNGRLDLSLLDNCYGSGMTVRQIVAKIHEYIKAQALNAEVMAEQPRARDRIFSEVTRMLEKGEGRLPVSTTEIHAAFGNVEKTLEYTAMLDRVVFGSGTDIES